MTSILSDVAPRAGGRWVERDGAGLAWARTTTARCSRPAFGLRALPALHAWYSRFRSPSHHACGWRLALPTYAARFRAA